MRIAVAVAVASAALSACGPVEAGTAAIVGKERITSSDLDADVREFRKDLAANKMAEEQLNLSFSVPQMILLNVANARQYAEFARQKGVTVSDGEIDAIVTAQGGQAKIDQALLGSGIPLSEGRAAIRGLIIRQKLMAQLGAGSDQQSQQTALLKLTQEVEAAVPVRYSPRYGKFDPQQGFVADDRFGAVVAPESAPAGLGQ
jgi:peptidyl-prolyl cis-trans isomerase SurA